MSFFFIFCLIILPDELTELCIDYFCFAMYGKLTKSNQDKGKPANFKLNLQNYFILIVITTQAYGSTIYVLVVSYNFIISCFILAAERSRRRQK